MNPTKINVELTKSLTSYLDIFIKSLIFNYDDPNTIKFDVDYEILTSKDITEIDEKLIQEFISQFCEDYITIIKEELNLE